MQGTHFTVCMNCKKGYPFKCLKVLITLMDYFVSHGLTAKIDFKNYLLNLESVYILSNVQRVRGSLRSAQYH